MSPRAEGSARQAVDAHCPAAIVVGLDCVTGLQTARILHARGVPVIGIAGDPRSFCCRTRAVDEVIFADTCGESLIEALEELGPRLRHRAVLFPCGDASVLQIARERDRLTRWYHVALPDTDVLEMLQDKIRFAAFAEQLGLPVPRTFVLATRDDAVRAARELSFPVMLKPALRTPLWERYSAKKVYRADRAGELLFLYEECSAWSDALLVQEWIEGGDSALFSCNCYFDRERKPVATFVARKLRQWPPRIGVSSLGEECRNDEVREFTLRLFGAAGYHGLGYLEVKRDARTGKLYLIEANVGRPTGRSAIAEAGGVELLHAKYCDVLGLPLPTALEQRYIGAKWIFWRQDLRSAFYYWRRGELSLGEWVASLRGRKACAVFSWSDPAPFLADLAAITAEAWRNRRDRVGANHSRLELSPTPASEPGGAVLERAGRK